MADLGKLALGFLDAVLADIGEAGLYGVTNCLGRVGFGDGNDGNFTRVTSALAADLINLSLQKLPIVEQVRRHGWKYEDYAVAVKLLLPSFPHLTAVRGWLN